MVRALMLSILTFSSGLFAHYPTLSTIPAENLEIAIQMIEGYLGKPSPISIKRLPSQHPITHFTKRCLLTHIQTPAHIKALLEDNKIFIEKDKSKGTNVYKLGITKRPDIEDFIAVSFPDRPDLELYSTILPLDIRITRKQIKLTDSELIDLINEMFSFTFTKNPKRRLGIHKPYKYLGEDEWTKRIHISCAELGWSCYDFTYIPETTLRKSYQDHIFTTITTAFSPEYTFNILFKLPMLQTPGIKLSYITDNLNLIIDSKGLPTDLGKQLLEFDGYIDGNPNQDWLKDLTKTNNKPDAFILHGYPTSQTTQYREPTFNGIFYCGNNWDSGRSSETAKNLFRALEKLGLMYVYGPEGVWKHLGSSYKGFIPLDGTSLIDRIHDCGVGLCIHSNEHMHANIPMSRFFEICAAGAIAICDNHPWIREHFGDDALFFDHTQSWEDRVADIKAHWDWIQSHPDEAKAMAKRAHAKFIEQYRMPLTLKLVEEICK